ncbi:MAG: helix-turn-helix domain-containing protein [Bacilli bacterium]|jgi:transcriptional regulator with XRE-family HTH domain|nr:helix-turn-helix domain-containing protein [Bacilli bacterium]
MSIGENIRKFRESKNLTQKDLAEKLSVTPQALSRWENDNVEPSLDSIRQMSEIFGVSLDELINDKAEAKPEEVVPLPVAEVKEAEPVKEAEEVKAEEPVNTEPAVIGTCARCGKEIHSGESYQSGYVTTKKVSYGRNRYHEQTGFVLSNDYGADALFCQDCADQMTEEEQKAEANKAYALREHNKKVMTWSIVVGALALVIVILIASFQVQANPQTGIILFCLSPLLTYLFFSLMYVLLSDNTFVSEMFMDILEFGFVKMPGVIFSFSLDGVISLIVIKIILGLLAFGIFLAVLAFAIAFCGFFSLFMFPVALSRNKNPGGSD